MPSKIVEKIKPHTVKKIDYITQYVSQWLCVACNSPKHNIINFIDAMSNSGEYVDENENSVLGTNIRIIDEIIPYLDNDKFRSKSFKLYFNDIDENKIAHLKEKVKCLGVEKYPNITIICSVCDVNDFLKNISDKLPDRYDMLTLLYVDPYNIGTVKIERIRDFLWNNYAELLYNININDYNRNRLSNTRDNKIKSVFKPLFLKEEEPKDVPSELLYERLINYLRNKKSKYTFKYLFKNRKKGDLYFILFTTPHIKGLVKIKNALWSIFKGCPYCIVDKNDEDSNQIGLVAEVELENMLIDSYASECRAELIKVFKGQTLSYDDILAYVLERTMLKQGHLIKKILRPLVKSDKITKTGKAQKYIAEKYTFI